MKMLFKLTVLVFLFISSTLDAQKTIIERLTTIDSITNAKVIVHQDSRINELISPSKTQQGKLLQSNTNGFRVQVFSSNTQRTAKSEAFLIEKRIKEAFPDANVYVSYLSPFWKVRVGDFTSTQQAREFLNKVLDEFPEFKGSAYTVRDQIIINR